jgi:hypothetical protein
VLANDLEAVEDEAGAVGVEAVGGAAGEDLVECVLELAAVGGSGEVEASAGAAGVGSERGLRSGWW